MASITEQAGAGKPAYSRPTIEDYGSLEALTADFDLHFVGSVARLATMTAASGPMGGGGGGDPEPPHVSTVGSPPDGGMPPADGGAPPDGGTTPEQPESGTRGEGHSGGGRDTWSGSLPASGEAPVGAQGPGGGGGGVREEVAGGAGLPFTGYAAWAAAAIGAAMTTSGVVLRDLLRRRR